jgi:hypothetical protein
VRHTNKVDARDIADEVAKAYKAYRTEIETRDADRQLQELNKAVRDQEDKVEERRKVLATIVRTKGIIYKGRTRITTTGWTRTRAPRARFKPTTRSSRKNPVGKPDQQPC